MKYLILFALVALSLSYAGYYLYMFDKKEKVHRENEDSKRDSGDNIAGEAQEIPEHLTQGFWENVTPEQLTEKLKHIENINEVRPDDNQSMLHLLVLHGQYPEMIASLISAGVDYTLNEAGHGRKALHYAVIRGNQAYEFTKELLVYDKDIDAKDTRYGSTPLSWAVFFRSDIKTLQLLLERGANPNFQSKNGGTSLMAASFPNRFIKVSFIDPEVIQLLLDYKADITIKNDEGKTALDYMKKNKEFKKTELFKKLSAQFH